MMVALKNWYLEIEIKLSKNETTIIRGRRLQPFKFYENSCIFEHSFLQTWSQVIKTQGWCTQLTPLVNERRQTSVNKERTIILEGINFVQNFYVW